MVETDVTGARINKEKITLNDPTVTGAGNAFMGRLGLRLWNAEEAKEFLRQLIKQQEAVIQRDNRIHVESVARGKFAIGLAPNEDNLAQFLKAGAPVAMFIPRKVYTLLRELAPSRYRLNRLILMPPAFS